MSVAKLASLFILWRLITVTFQPFFFSAEGKLTRMSAEPWRGENKPFYCSLQHSLHVEARKSFATDFPSSWNTSADANATELISQVWSVCFFLRTHWHSLTLKDIEQWNDSNNVKDIGALSAKCVCWEPFCVLFGFPGLEMRKRATQKVNRSHSWSPLILRLSIKSKKKQLVVTGRWTGTYVTHWFTPLDKSHWWKTRQNS